MVKSPPTGANSTSTLPMDWIASGPSSCPRSPRWTKCRSLSSSTYMVLPPLSDPWVVSWKVWKPELYAEEETATVGSVDVTGFHTFHDTTHGSERGGNTIYVLEDNDLPLVHLGDLGHELGPDAIQSIGRVDVLLAPVGGLFTIDAATAARVVDALHPRVVIPMHYKTPDCGFDLAPVEDFLKTQDQVERWEEPTIILDPGSLPRERTTIVLPYVS